MKQLDFLPRKYQERAAQRIAQLWRIAVIALFGTVVAASVMAQTAWRRDVKRQLARLETQHAGALAQDARYVQLQADYHQLEDRAELLIYLRHPWPCTQVLAQITQSLPASVVLSKVRVAQERPEPDHRVSAVAAEMENPDALKALPPFQQDLKLLRKEHDALQTIVRVFGYTNDPAALQNYVSLLAGNPLIAKSELRSLESHAETRTHGDARFTLLLVVRPGYGQPGGPTQAPQLTATSRRETESERRQ